MNSIEGCLPPQPPPLFVRAKIHLLTYGPNVESLIPSKEIQMRESGRLFLWLPEAGRMRGAPSPYPSRATRLDIHLVLRITAKAPLVADNRGTLRLDNGWGTARSQVIMTDRRSPTISYHIQHPRLIRDSWGYMAYTYHLCGLDLVSVIPSWQRESWTRAPSDVTLWSITLIHPIIAYSDYAPANGQITIFRSLKWSSEGTIYTSYSVFIWH